MTTSPWAPSTLPGGTRAAHTPRVLFHLVTPYITVPGAFQEGGGETGLSYLLDHFHP